MPDYATRQSVKDLLLLGTLEQGGGRIDTSEFYIALMAAEANTGTGRLKRVRFDDSYFGVANFILTFTSSDDFGVVMQVSPNEVQIDLGTGSTAANFTAEHPYDSTLDLFAINTGDWSGAPIAGDIFQWQSASRISNLLVDGFIGKAEREIDNWLRSSRLYDIDAADPDRYYVANPPVPDLISDATTYLTAFLITQAVHPGAKLNESAYFQWWSTARDDIKLWVAGTKRRGPSIRRPLSRLDHVGVAGMGLDLAMRQAIETTYLGATVDNADLRAELEMTVVDTIARAASEVL